MDLSRYRVFLFDLDGTLFCGGKPFEYTRELMTTLRKARRELFVVTNNSGVNETAVLHKLRNAGVTFPRERVLISTHHAVEALRDKFKTVLLIGTPACATLFRNHGYRVLSPLRMSKRPDCVIVGFDTTVTYEKLAVATAWIEKGVPYGAIHGDFSCPSPVGRVPDCGALVSAIESVVKKPPQFVFGKPNPRMVEIAEKRMPFRRTEAVMVGDCLDTDMEVARRAGIDSILVLTGETSRAELSHWQEGTYQPKVLASVAVRGRGRAPTYVISTLFPLLKGAKKLVSNLQVEVQNSDKGPWSRTSKRGIGSPRPLETW